MTESIEKTVDACIKEAFNLGVESQQKNSILSVDAMQQHKKPSMKELWLAYKTN